MAANYEQPDYVDKRVRYYDGLFLKDQDLIDEQKYHVDRTRRLSKVLQVSGISEGLAIANAGTDRATVNPGTAVDAKGRFIVLAAPQEISLANYRNRASFVVISYQKIQSDFAEDGSEDYRRWQEKPLIQVILEGETLPAEAITLAKLNVDKDGIVSVNNSVRQYSGLYLPAAGGIGPILRSGGDSASNKAILTGDLSVSGSLEASSLAIGTASIADNLTVNGSITSSSLSVGSGSISAGNATITGNLSFGETTRQTINWSQQLYGIGVQNDTQYFRTNKNFAWYKGGTHNNSALDAGNGTIQMAIADGNLGIGTASPQAKLDVQGTIKSPMWRVTQVLNQQGISALPMTTSQFTTGGGTLLILFSSTAYTSIVGSMGFKIKVDALDVGTIRRFSNEINTHKFLAGSLVVSGIAAGTHTIGIDRFTTQTNADVNSLCSLIICEFPF